MNLLDRLEQKFGGLAIHNLLGIIAGGQACFYVVSLARPDIFSWLLFDPWLIRRGEIWRLVSFIFFPPAGNPLIAFFAIYWLYLLGQGLEQAWGSFKLNVYYLIGVLGHIALGFWFGGGLSPEYLNLSLVLAFAYLYPDFEFLFFFVLPVKMRWLAWFDAAFLLYRVVTGGTFVALLVLLSLANYALFFGRDWLGRMRRQGQVLQNRAVFAKAEAELAKQPPKRCTQCQRDVHQADLRLCTCPACGPDGRFWCLEHLKPHLAEQKNQ